MKQSDLALAYQALLWERFPGVMVFSDQGGLEDANVLDVFLVPDRKWREFDNYYYDEVQPRALKQGLPFVVLVPHNETNSRTFYPELLSATLPSSGVIVNTCLSTIENILFQLDQNGLNFQEGLTVLAPITTGNTSLGGTAFVVNATNTYYSAMPIIFTSVEINPFFLTLPSKGDEVVYPVAGKDAPFQAEEPELKAA